MKALISGISLVVLGLIVFVIGLTASFESSQSASLLIMLSIVLGVGGAALICVGTAQTIEEKRGPQPVKEPKPKYKKPKYKKPKNSEEAEMFSQFESAASAAMSKVSK